jgi:hypothetical protein
MVEKQSSNAKKSTFEEEKKGGHDWPELAGEM